MARFFGVRDVGLGALVFWSLAHPETLPFVLLFNALTDFGDLVAIVAPPDADRAHAALAALTAGSCRPCGSRTGDFPGTRPWGPSQSREAAQGRSGPGNRRRPISFEEATGAAAA